MLCSTWSYYCDGSQSLLGNLKICNTWETSTRKRLKLDCLHVNSERYHISYSDLWRENILLLLTTWYKHRPSPQQEARKWPHQKQCYTHGLAEEKENFRIFLTPFWILPQTHICLGCPNEYLLQIQWCKSQRIQQQTQWRFQLARQKISSQLFAKKFSGSSHRIFWTWSSCSKM